MLTAALDRAREGWHVLPCRETGERAKAPYLAHGLTDATTDPEVITAWWTRWPDALLGLRVPAGVVVVDLDPRHIPTCEPTMSEHQSMTAALTHLAVSVHAVDLTETLAVVSGRRDGGVHLYYRAPSLPEGWRWRAHPVRSDGTDVEGVDVRKPGGAYLIAPPSLHPATGRRYRWAGDCPGTPAPLPVSLARACTRRPAVAAPAPVQRLHGGLARPGAHSSSGLVRAVAEAAEGTRNSILHWAVNRVLDDGMGTEELRAVGEAAMRAGLPEVEVSRTIASVLRTRGGEAA